MRIKARNQGFHGAELRFPCFLPLFEPGFHFGDLIVDAFEVGRDALVDVGHDRVVGVHDVTADDGAIIIMDGSDLDTFVNLINEDYIESKITGKRYEIKSKKLLGEPEGEPPRG